MKTETQEESLTRRAVLARERLLAVVDELDRKRHSLAHPMQLVTRRPSASVVTSGKFLAAAALVAAGSIAFMVIARQKAKKKQARRFFQRRPPEPSFWADVASRAAKALTAFALIEAGKRAIRLAERAPRG